MSTNNKKHRKPSNVNSRRWMAYAAAGAATAMGAQATVDADITHVVLNLPIVDSNPSDPYFSSFGPFTFGGAGAGFYMLHAFPNTQAYGIAEGYFLGNGAFAGATINSYAYPLNAPYGQFVSALTAFTAGNRAAYLAWTSGFPNSQFLNPGIGYLGFRFDLGAGTQYGWARVNMDGTPTNTYTLVDYAYAGLGESIFVGQVPEPGSLGMLAIGAAGLLTWRRRRRAEQRN